MPITSIPMVNKFGILSEKQRLEITERLCRKTAFNNTAAQHSFLAQKNPLEVTEEFVQEYNAVNTETEQKKLLTMALKMLARIKRRVGLNSFGIGRHVNLPVAWTELAQLVECRGTIQDECLDCLLLSLNEAPINQNQVASLFFLAESILFLLRTQSLQQPYLRSVEIKQLKVCQLLFIRLYFHKMAGHLHNCDEFKHRLGCFFQGLSNCLSLYSAYPDAQLCLKFMLQVASIILTNTDLDFGGMEDVQTNQYSRKKDSPETLRPCMSNEESCMSESCCPSNYNSWRSSCIHDLSPALWHSLDVWKCQNLQETSRNLNKNKSQNSCHESLRSLILCSFSPDNESCWVDCFVAVVILAEAAKINLTTLKVLQNLACHCINRTNARCESLATPPRHETGHGCRQEDRKKESSATIKENKKQPKIHLNATEQEEDDKEVNEQVSSETLSKGDTLFVPTGKAETPKTSTTQMSSFSNISSDITAFNSYNESSFYQWNWDIAFTYTTLLGDIVLDARSSSIQKRALLGTNKDITRESFLAKQHRCEEVLLNKETINNEDNLGCYVGLFDLTFFQSSFNFPIEAESNWSWKVRFGAIQTLIRICEKLSKDPTKEGLQTAAWGILYQANVTERDPRVLEALRVGSVQSNINLLMKSKPVQCFPGGLGSHLANGLVNIYLTVPSCKQQLRKEKIVISGGATNKEIGDDENQKRRKDKCFKKHRTTLREEILFRTTWHVTPMNYNTRTTFHLRRLVEDQWRKDLVREAIKDEGLSPQEDYQKTVLGCLGSTKSVEQCLGLVNLKCQDKNKAKIFQSDEEAKRQAEEEGKEEISQEKKSEEKN